DFTHNEEFRQTLMLTHDINDDWTYQIGGNSLFYNYTNSVTAPSANPAPGFFPDVPPPLYYRERDDFPIAQDQSQSLITNLAGEFYTGELLHKAVIGMEYNYFDSASRLEIATLGPADVTTLPYNNPAPLFDLAAIDIPVFRQHRIGGYIEDLVEVTPHWKLLGGVRFDALNLDYDRTAFIGGPGINVDTDDTFYRTSPRGGVVYQPWLDKELALYFNYSQSFTPPGGSIYLNPKPIRPVTGEQFELGIKTEVVENCTFNVAGFHNVRRNADLNNRAFVLAQLGEERSQGVEMNLLGQLTERWSAVANYTYTDTLLSDDDPAFDGQRQRNVPFNTANFWTRYNVIQDEVHTLGAAVGLVYLGDRSGSFVDPLVLQSYSRWDAGVFYNRGRAYASLYAENLFDVNYATNSFDAYQVFPGAPINARAQFGYVY
ncbi:MAG TPA: TonB-dependent receptor, partial [Pirellulaceae bacterium]|nr:TonB-dependent receptor [Pirellulaceae bacterium]